MAVHLSFASMAQPPKFRSASRHMAGKCFELLKYGVEGEVMLCCAGVLKWSTLMVPCRNQICNEINHLHSLTSPKHAPAKLSSCTKAWRQLSGHAQGGSEQIGSDPEECSSSSTSALEFAVRPTSASDGHRCHTHDLQSNTW